VFRELRRMGDLLTDGHVVHVGYLKSWTHGCCESTEGGVSGIVYIYVRAEAQDLEYLPIL
jgi:hypothetical protein